MSPYPRQLCDLYPRTGSIASVYFDLRAGATEVFVRWHALVEALTRQGADRGLIEVVRAGVMGAVPGRGVLALFAAEGRVLLSVVIPEGTAPDRARYGLPHLLPLLAWLQGRPAHVVALLDRVGTGVVVHPGGAAAETRAVPGDEVVELLVPLLHKVPVHLLINTGSSRAERIADDSNLVTADRTASLLTALERERTRPGSLAVVGAGATLEALGQRRVRTLLLADDAPITAPDRTASDGVANQGGPSARMAWYGPGPTDLALDPESLSGFEARWPRRGHLVDVATGAALREGAKVHVLPTDTSRENVPDGIAALCRQP